MSEINLEERVAELEVQIAFQEDHIQKLSDALYQQQQRLDALEVGIKHYEKRLKELQEGVGEVYSGQEKPPHY